MLDVSALAELLELLSRAQEPFDTLRATYRIWSHTERATAAFMASARETGRAMSMSSGSDPRSPVETEQVLRIWRAPHRARVERDDGEPSYGVRVGELWWDWRDSAGASTNEHDAEGRMRSQIGRELEPLLDPTRLLGALRFEVIGGGQQAGRKTITVTAEPRWPSGDQHDAYFARLQFGLHALGSGADRYVFAVDAERGVLLYVEALRDGQPFQRTEATEIAFDEALDDQLFVFRAAPAQVIRSASETFGQPERLSIIEAHQRTDFTG
jgi:hypothetical protein